jgi:SAM-dependent methyltransferase
MHRATPKTSKIRAFILARSEHLPWLWHGIFAFGLTAGIRFLLEALGFKFDIKPAGEGVLDVIILFVSFLIVNFVTTQSLGGLFQLVTHVMAVAERQSNPLLKLSVTAYFDDARAVVDGLTGSGLVVKSNLDMEKWYRSFFELGGDQYIGIDTFPPAKWMSRYGFYLRIHEDSILQRKREGRYFAPDCRIILATSDQMRHDRSSDEGNYEEFSGWHWDPDHLVELYWADSHALPSDILKLRHLLPTPAVALWEDFAVLFEYVDVDGEPGTKLQARFPYLGGSPSYEQVRDYVMKMQEFARAKPFKGGDVGLDIVELEVAQRWNDYVGFADRVSGRDNPLGDFLLARIDEKFPDRDCTILDAAAGSGCDAIFLIRRGLRVDINEADPRYAEMIQKNADDQALGLGRRGGLRAARLPLTNITWQDLHSGLPPGSRYHIVLVLGNSFCLVEPRDRRKCLQELAGVLYKNGMLIIDERNFSDVLARADEYTSNPLLFPSARGPDPVYRGRSVRGCPEEIHPDLISWRIFNAEPPIRAPEDLKGRWIGKKAFELYPFRRGELHEQLSTHFQSVQAFADFAPLPNGPPSLGDPPGQQPLFYTYVASGPQAGS